MFTQHFQMTHTPFQEHTAPQELLQDERISQGMARLQYFVHCGVLALLTGPTGVGKSSLLKLFIQSASPNHFQPVYLHFTHLSSSAFLNLLLDALGEPLRRGKDRIFLQILEKTQKSELPILFIIDEAHLLDAEALTDLRLLVSSALQDAPSLRILLAGQEKLRHNLKQSAHADFLNRVSVRYHLPPLDQEQTHAYIDYQLKCAGVAEKTFDDEVKRLIHEYAHGIPRQINNLATACLLLAASRKAQKINLEIFQHTIAEFQLP